VAQSMWYPRIPQLFRPSLKKKESCLEGRWKSCMPFVAALAHTAKQLEHVQGLCESCRPTGLMQARLEQLSFQQCVSLSHQQKHGNRPLLKCCWMLVFRATQRLGAWLWSKELHSHAPSLHPCCTWQQPPIHQRWSDSYVQLMFRRQCKTLTAGRRLLLPCSMDTNNVPSR